MSWNLPGTGVDFEATEAPVNGTACTGNFAEKLNCQEYGNFLWVGAFCVFILFCGLCSCCVLTPLIRCFREARSSSRSSSSPSSSDINKPKRPSAVYPEQKPKDTFTPAYAPNGDRSSRGNKDGSSENRLSAKHGKGKRPSSSTSLQRHWYLTDTLRISEEDRMELGPSMWGSARLSRPSSRSYRGYDLRGTRVPSRHARGNRAVVEDPGVGAEATARGGGWMGAANGRF